MLLVLVDLEKAFNRVSHQLVIEDLADMHVPGWLLLILISYLTERSMYMRHRGATSSRKFLSGSSPQGAFLGILLFIIIFNGALLRPAIPRLHSLNLKYIDDLSMLAAYNLKTSLIDDPVERPRPHNFNERTMQVMAREHNTLQDDLSSLSEFSCKKLLKIKENKTQVMKFNFARNSDFPPELEVDNFENMIEVTTNAKLLGIIVTNDLKWEANTDYICTKAFKKMWTLRRMKILDIHPDTILDVYVKEIRAVVELAVPAWHSGLTKKQTATIERVQRCAVSIILSDCITGKCDFSYDRGLAKLNIQPLEDRRNKLCKTFAQKTLKSRHADIFKANTNQHFTRAKPGFLTNKCNTKRYFNSPINYLTRILNSES